MRHGSHVVNKSKIHLRLRMMENFNKKMITLKKSKRKFKKEVEECQQEGNNWERFNRGDLSKGNKEEKTREKGKKISKRRIEKEGRIGGKMRKNKANRWISIKFWLMRESKSQSLNQKICLMIDKM